jgi:high-affinity iron transporter
MKRLTPLALSTSLALFGCGDTDRDLPARYRRLAVPSTLLASVEAQSRGHELFVKHCALCHGETGQGNGPRREGLTKPPRNFADPVWRQSTSPRRVFFAIREGVRGTAMPAWSSLSEQETWDLTAYVLSLGEAR